MARIPKLDAAGRFLAADVNAQIDARTKATMRADLPALAKELKIGGVEGSVPIFPTLAEAQAWEAKNPGKTALTLEPSTPDTTAPYAAGTLTVTPAYTSAMLYVSGAQDDRAVTGYAFSSNGGTTWSAWQTAPSFTVTGLTGSTQYTFKHKVRDAAGNETAGVAVTASTTAAPAMTPAEVGSLWGHWDASVAESLTLSGASVTGWKGLTANARVVSQATAAQQPVTSTINGKTAVKFDKAASQMLRHQSTFTIDATVGYTVVWVGRFDDGDLSASQAVASLNAGSALGRRAPDGLIQSLQNPTLDGPASVKPGAGQVVMLALAVKANAPSFAWVSGQAGTSKTLSAGNPATALDLGRNASGGDKYASATVGEFWIHDKQLTTTELSSLHQYAQQKWGAA